MMAAPLRRHEFRTKDVVRHPDRILEGEVVETETHFAKVRWEDGAEEVIEQLDPRYVVTFRGSTAIEELRYLVKEYDVDMDVDDDSNIEEVVDAIRDHVEGLRDEARELEDTADDLERDLRKILNEHRG